MRAFNGATDGLPVGDLVELVILAVVFVAIGLLRLPLPAVLLVAIPISFVITFVMRRRTGAT